jgi:hypothetical protein
VDLGCGHGEVLLAAHAAYPECRVVSELLRNIAKIWLRYVYTCIVYGSIYVYITYIYMSILHIYICLLYYIYMYMWMVMIWLRYGLEREDQSPQVTYVW